MLNSIQYSCSCYLTHARLVFPNMERTSPNPIMMRPNTSLFRAGIALYRVQSPAIPRYEACTSFFLGYKLTFI